MASAAASASAWVTAAWALACAGVWLAVVFCCLCLELLLIFSTFSFLSCSSTMVFLHTAQPLLMAASKGEGAKGMFSMRRCREEGRERRVTEGRERRRGRGEGGDDCAPASKSSLSAAHR